MRWRGIKSQSQLARLSGVSQSSIHRILARGDAYAASWQTLQRLARALNTTASWLSDEQAAPAADCRHRCPPDGDSAELDTLMTRLPAPIRRNLFGLVRALAEHGGREGDT